MCLHDAQNQTRHERLGAGFGHCRRVHTVPGVSTNQENITWASRSENDSNGHTVGIAKSKLWAIFANGES